VGFVEQSQTGGQRLAEAGFLSFSVSSISAWARTSSG
jgi:hypothetical protein